MHDAFITELEALCKKHGIYVDGDYERPLVIREMRRPYRLVRLTPNGSTLMWVNDDEPQPKEKK